MKNGIKKFGYCVICYRSIIIYRYNNKGVTVNINMTSINSIVLDNPTFEERNIKYWYFHQHENTKKDKKEYVENIRQPNHE